MIAGSALVLFVVQSIFVRQERLHAQAMPVL
jgi:hypothetical protein